MKEMERKRTLQRLAVHLGISILLFAGLHTAYQRWNGRLSKLPPAYSYADGFFLLANVSTLAKPVDTDNPELAAVISQPLVFASTPDQRNGRNQEMFSPVGLIGRIKTAMNSEYLANLECKRIAYRVIRRDPIGFLRLAFHTYVRFFSKEYMILSSISVTFITCFTVHLLARCRRKMSSNTYVLKFPMCTKL